MHDAHAAYAACCCNTLSARLAIERLYMPFVRLCVRGHVDVAMLAGPGQRQSTGTALDPKQMSQIAGHDLDGRNILRQI